MNVNPALIGYLFKWLCTSTSCTPPLKPQSPFSLCLLLTNKPNNRSFPSWVILSFFCTLLPSHWKTPFRGTSTFYEWIVPQIVRKTSYSMKLTSLILVFTRDRRFQFPRLVVDTAETMLWSLQLVLQRCCSHLFLYILQCWHWAPGCIRANTAHQVWKTPQWSRGQVCIQEFKFCCLRLSVSPALEVSTQGPLHNPQTPIIPFLWAP